MSNCKKCHRPLREGENNYCPNCKNERDRTGKVVIEVIGSLLVGIVGGILVGKNKLGNGKDGKK